MKRIYLNFRRILAVATDIAKFVYYLRPFFEWIWNVAWRSILN